MPLKIFLLFNYVYCIITLRRNGGFFMNEKLIKELDNESLMELLLSLETMDDECNKIIKEKKGDSNE